MSATSAIALVGGGPRGVSLLEHKPEWYLEDGVQKEVPSLEACSTQWHAFAVARKEGNSAANRARRSASDGNRAARVSSAVARG